MLLILTPLVSPTERDSDSQLIKLSTRKQLVEDVYLNLINTEIPSI